MDDDEMIYVRFNFGGQWDEDGGTQYIGGEVFEVSVGFDVDRFGFWNMHNFYTKILEMENARLWYRKGDVNGDGEIVKIENDRSVVEMIRVQKNVHLTDVYGVEVGDVVDSRETLKSRLEAALVKDKDLENQQMGSQFSEDEWSDDNECVMGVDKGTRGDIDSPLEECEDDDEYVPSHEEEDIDEEEDVDEDEDLIVEEEFAGVDEVVAEDEFDVVDEVVAEDDHAGVDEAVAEDELAGVVEADDGVDNHPLPTAAAVADEADIDDPVIVGDTELLDVRHDSDDEGVLQFPWFKGEVDKDGKLILVTGMKFQNQFILRKALKEWSVDMGCHYVYEKNNKKRVTAVCQKKCGFRMHASVINDEGVFQIKTWKPIHKCPRKWKNQLVTARFLVDKFIKDFRDNPEWKVAAMMKTFQKKLQAQVSVKQCYKARKLAKQIIQGEVATQYYRLRDYDSVILNKDPGSRFKLSTKEGSPGWTKEKTNNSLHPSLVPLPPMPQFQYLYLRFAAQKNAFFLGLRPFVGLDGCFLKGVMGGQLLSAVAKDGNDTMYPLAIAVVDAEDKASWTWFLENIFDNFGHPRDTGMVFMSDKQKGLQEAMNQLMPGVEHRICVKHLYENFKGIYKGREYKELLWLAAGTGSIPKWQFYLEKMKKLTMGEQAVALLMKNDPRSWSRSHFSPHCKTDLIVNNISESFNASIIAERDKPILTLLEWIRRKLMKKIYDKNAKMAAYNGNICPNIVKTLNHNKLLAGNYFATTAGELKYEIDCGGTSNVVDVAAKTCTCRMWELSGIPCKHAIAAIYKSRMEPEAFVDACYSKENYMEVYKHFIVPLPSSDEWPVTEEADVHPPFIRKPVGRPKKKRRRQVDEPTNSTKLTRIGGQVRYGNCKMVGHNIRGCKAAVTGETPWQRRQRQQKLHQSEVSEASASSIKVPKQKVKNMAVLGSQQSAASAL